MLEKLNEILNNFWVALCLAIFSLFAAMVERLSGSTGWCVANMVFAAYWLFIAWRVSRPIGSIEIDNKDMTQDDIDVLITIRDNMTSLIAKEQAKLDAKEKE